MRAVPQRSSLGVVVDREPAARVAVDVLQAALVDSGLTLVEVARQLGWTRRRAGATNGETDVDLTRVARRLGLKPWTSRGKTYVQKTVPYEAAVELIRAMDVDPVDYGI
jgi:hypothetical protein